MSVFRVTAALLIVGAVLNGLVLDSSAVIITERNKPPVSGSIEAILDAHGPLDLSLSPVTVDELVHGIRCAGRPTQNPQRLKAGDTGFFRR